MLSQAQKAILTFERNRFPDLAGKAQAVSALFHCTMSQYQAFLDEAVDTDGAQEYAPDVVQSTLWAREVRSQRGSTIPLLG